jgi:hypothetical protein
MGSFSSWAGLLRAAILEVDASEKLALISKTREAIAARLQAGHLSAAELQQISQNLDELRTLELETQEWIRSHSARGGNES